MPATPTIRTTHDGRLFRVEVMGWTDEAGREVTREVVRHPGAAVIVPRLADDRLVLIRNRRVAVDQTLLELAAGRLEPGEPPEETAARELVEETGYRAGRVAPLTTFYTSPGFADELIHVFVAEELEHVGQRLEPGEDIEVVVMPAEEAVALAAEGRLRDAKTIAALLVWDRSRRA